MAKAAPDLPDDLREILEIDPTLEKVRAATAEIADLSLDDIAFDPVIREPHATWALALNYKLHIEETGLTTSQTYPQIFLRMPVCQVGHKEPLWAPHKNIAEAYDYEGELAVIIGKPGRYIKREEAIACRRLFLLQRRLGARISGSQPAIRLGEKFRAFRQLRAVADDAR